MVEALLQLNIGEEIPVQLYQVVAELLALIYRLDQGVKKLRDKAGARLSQGAL